MALPAFRSEAYTLRDYLSPDGVIYRVCDNPRCQSSYFPNAKHQKYCCTSCRTSHHYDMNREDKIIYMRDYRSQQRVERQNTHRTSSTRMTKAELRAELDKAKQENALKDSKIEALESKIDTLQRSLDHIMLMMQNGVSVVRSEASGSIPQTLPEPQFFSGSLTVENTPVDTEDSTLAMAASMEGLDF